MPQEFHVLSCVTCKAFQVQIVKKSSNKWNCKVCNTKQSVLQVFSRGSSASCRQVVQQLNFARGHQAFQESRKTLEGIAQEEHLARQEVTEEEAEIHVDPSSSSKEFQFTQPEAVPVVKHPSGVLSLSQETSKWKIFLESEED